MGAALKTIETDGEGEEKDANFPCQTPDNLPEHHDLLSWVVLEDIDRRPCKRVCEKGELADDFDGDEVVADDATSLWPRTLSFGVRW